MGIEIMKDGKLIDPIKAAGRLLPLDTALACPCCESQQVCAGEARATIRIGQEYPDGIPRKQDRKCLDCGARWSAILPPVVYHKHFLPNRPSR